jgi:hypothetical protein
MPQQREPCPSWKEQNYPLILLELSSPPFALLCPNCSPHECLQMRKEVLEEDEGVMWEVVVAMHLVGSRLHRFHIIFLMAHVNIHGKILQSAKESINYQGRHSFSHNMYKWEQVKYITQPSMDAMMFNVQKTKFYMVYIWRWLLYNCGARSGEQGFLILIFKILKQPWKMRPIPWIMKLWTS